MERQIGQVVWRLNHVSRHCWWKLCWHWLIWRHISCSCNGERQIVHSSCWCTSSSSSSAVVEFKFEVVDSGDSYKKIVVFKLIVSKDRRDESVESVNDWMGSKPPIMTLISPVLLSVVWLFADRPFRRCCKNDWNKLETALEKDIALVGLCSVAEEVEEEEVESVDEKLK